MVFIDDVTTVSNLRITALNIIFLRNNLFFRFITDVRGSGVNIKRM